MTDIEIAIIVKNMAREMVKRATAKNASNIKYKFKVGDRVKYTNGNGVYLGERTITQLDERSGEPTYFIKPTDSPWFSVREELLQKV